MLHIAQKKLDLSLNGFGDAGASALASGLQAPVSVAKGLEHDSVHESTASTDTRIVHQTECSIPAYISSLGDAHGMMEWSFVFLFSVFQGTSVILGIFHCLVPQDRASVS